MSTYYLSGQAAEGFAPSNDLGVALKRVTETAGSKTIPVANGATEASFAITDRLIPSNAAWEAGAATVKVNVTTASADIHLSVQAVRMNALGVAQESSGTTAEQTLGSNGVYTFNIPSKTWAAGACDDRYLVWYYFRSSKAHGGDASVIIETGTTDTSVVVANLTEFAGLCYSAFTRDFEQFARDHTSKVSLGATLAADDGVTENIYLDGYVKAALREQELTAKVEVEAIGTAFNDVATETAPINLSADPDRPNIRRSASVVYDSTRQRYLLIGGLGDEGEQYNDVWEFYSKPVQGAPKGQWRELSPTGTAMSARRTHVAEYDATNDRVIVGFGYDGADKADIFEIDFAASDQGVWGTLTPSGGPPTARAQPSSAYKATGDKFYLICGWGAARYNDVWELDCTTQGSEVWTQLNSGGGTAPTVRNDPATIYDATNDRLIIFGGFNGTTYYNDTWELDLTTNNYTDLTGSITGTAPTTRELSQAVYDPINERMVITGGRAGTTSALVRRDILQLDLTSGSEAWTDLTPSDGESPPYVWSNGVAIYDPEIDAMVIITGMDESLKESRFMTAWDLATADSATPYSIFENHGLRGRDAMGYAYNPDLRHTLVAGGFCDPEAGTTSASLDNGQHSGELWIYDHINQDWLQPVRDSSFSMTPREGLTAVYDTSRNRFILFGGLASNGLADNNYYNDVWEVKPDTDNIYRLTKLNPTGTKPSKRWLHAGVYDETNDRMIIFGGENAAGSYLNDVYELDFSGSADGAWGTVSPSGTAPSGRRQPGYIYDATNGRMVLFSGNTSGTATMDDAVWELDLTDGVEAWTDITPGGGPSSRLTASRGLVAVYAPDKEYALIFGGFDGTNVHAETWKFDLATDAYTLFAPTSAPSARRSHAGGYDPTSEAFVIFGGRDSANTGDSFVTRATTWEFDTTNVTESNWDWGNVVAQVFLQASVPLTGLSTAEDYHWQFWASTADGDSELKSFGGNPESGIDFSTAGVGAVTVKITKGAIYAIKKAILITKGAIYAVVSTATAITKSARYAIQDSTLLQKGAQYVVSFTATAITKSAQYAVKFTPAIIQKSASYFIQATATAIQKSAQYAIKYSTPLAKGAQYVISATATAITKSAQYTISYTATAITKSAQYVVQVTTTTGITKSAQYAISFTATLIQKGATYVISSTPTAITKAAQYAISSTTTAIQKSAQYTIASVATAITKSAQYLILTSTLIQKSARYVIDLGSVAITKSAQYAVLTSLLIQKSAQYTISLTATAITKSAEYQVKASLLIQKSAQYAIDLGSTAITKSAQYAVATTTAITKGAQYAITLTATAITKSAIYVVVNRVTIQKAAQYVIHATASAITKSAQYTVLTSTLIQKGAEYFISTSATAITKGASYLVQATQLIQKGASYTIFTATGITKASTYAVKASTLIQKSAQYVIGLGAVTIQKSALYTILTTTIIQKGASYFISILANGITKGAIYAVQSSTLIQKGAQYSISVLATSITKGAEYRVKLSTLVQKSAQYTVTLTASAITKVSVYRISITSLIQKSAQYVIHSTATAITKSSQYAVKITASVITKGADYVIAGGTLIQRSAQYTISSTTAAITKSAEYAISLATGITKGATYLVHASQLITKTAQYTIATVATAIQKSGQYAVRISTVINKTAQYTISSVVTAITKTSDYYILVRTTLQKSAQYIITATVGAINKASQYAVLTSTLIQKGATYIISSAQAVTKSATYAIHFTAIVITKTSEYAVSLATGITKAAQYVVQAPQLITKGAIYAVTVLATGITKGAIYTIQSAVKLTKSAQYTITIVASAITKTAQYAVLTQTLITKSAQYIIDTGATVIQKAAQYTIIKVISIQLSAAYEIVTTSAITKSAQYLIYSSTVIAKTAIYSVITPGVIAKSAQYTLKTLSLIARGAVYVISLATSITKAGAYKVLSSNLVQKASRYEIFTVVTRSITKPAEYVIVRPAIQLPAEYAITIKNCYPYNKVGSPYADSASPFTKMNNPYSDFPDCDADIEFYFFEDGLLFEFEDGDDFEFD